MIHISTCKQGGESVRQRGEECIYIFGLQRGREMEYFKETAAIHKVKYLMWILITQNLNDEVHSSEYINLGSYRPAQRMELSIMTAIHGENTFTLIGLSLQSIYPEGIRDRGPWIKVQINDTH